jgi:hypothetical protein
MPVSPDHIDTTLFNLYSLDIMHAYLLHAYPGLQQGPRDHEPALRTEGAVVPVPPAPSAGPSLRIFWVCCSYSIHKVEVSSVAFPSTGFPPFPVHFSFQSLPFPPLFPAEERETSEKWGKEQKKVTGLLSSTAKSPAFGALSHAPVALPALALLQVQRTREALESGLLRPCHCTGTSGLSCCTPVHQQLPPVLPPVCHR